MRDFVCVSPPGGKPEGNLVPSQMGKAPAKRTPTGTWRGYSWLNAERPDEETIREWLDEGANLGLIAARFPALDIDSLDAKLVEHVMAFAEERLGKAPVRVGKAPKTLMIYRCDDDLPKRVLHLEDAEGKRHLVEFLGAKQQYLIYGTHPSGTPYTWVKPIEGEIPSVTGEAVEEFFKQLATCLPDGYKVVGRGASGPAAQVDAEKLVAPSLDALRKLMRGLPNKADRNDWVRVGLAVKGACGEHDDDGYEIFSEWSGRWEDGVNTEDEVRRTWRSLHSKQLGWEFLEALARDADGAPDARDLFDDTTPETDDFSLRLARLVGAERVFLRELRGELRGEALRVRLSELQAAENSRDPLAPTLHGLLRLCEKRTSIYPVTDEERTRRIIQEVVGRGKRPTAETDLLVEAAMLMLMDRGAILSRGKLVPVPPEEGEIEWLIEGLVPSNGIAALVGAPGQGKTHIAIHWTKLVSCDKGTPSPIPDEADTFPTFFGREVRRGSVLYFAGEDVRGVLSRMIRCGVNMENVSTFNHVPNFSNFSEANRDIVQAMESLSNKPPVRLIVVDMLFHAMNGDENTVEAMRPVMRTAEAVARLWDCTVLFVHHPSKSEKELNVISPRGSSAFEGAVDYWAAVGNHAKDGGNGSRRISMLERKNKHAGQNPEPFRFFLDDRVGLIEGDAPKQETVTGEMMGKAILAVLAENDPLNSGMTDKTVKAEVKRMRPEWHPSYNVFHNRYINGRKWAIDNGLATLYAGKSIRRILGGG